MGGHALRWQPGARSELVEQADALFEPRPPHADKRPKVACCRGPCRRARVRRRARMPAYTPGLVQRAVVLLETASELRASEDRVKSLSLTGDSVLSSWRAPARGRAVVRRGVWEGGEQEIAVATTHLGRLRRRRLGVAFRIRDFLRPRTIIRFVGR